MEQAEFLKNELNRLVWFRGRMPVEDMKRLVRQVQRSGIISQVEILTHSLDSGDRCSVLGLLLQANGSRNSTRSNSRFGTRFVNRDTKSCTLSEIVVVVPFPRSRFAGFVGFVSFFLQGQWS